MKFRKIEITALILSILIIASGCTKINEKKPITTPPSAEKIINKEPIKEKNQTQIKEEKTAITPSLKVKNQKPDNNSIIIEEVTSPKPGWIVIHSSQNNQIGNLLGYAPISKGINKNIKVEINLKKATKKAFATLHEDDGKINIFEFPASDNPITLNEKAVKK